MKFKSKIDWWLALIVWGPVTIAWASVLQNLKWPVVIGNLGLTALIALFWFGTYYIIENDLLIVSIGISRKQIPIERITSIRVSRSLASSAALSLDRIEINYRETEIFPDVVYVSPKDQHGFLRRLLEHNPKIELDEKLRALLEEIS